MDGAKPGQSRKKLRASPQVGLETYRLGEQIGFVIRKASQRHTAIFAKRMLEQLTTTQWAALVKVAKLGPVSQNQLGRDTAMDVATIKGVVDRLIARGFVTARSDPADSRRNLIALTRDGAAFVRAGLPIATGITEDTLKGLTSGERQMLLELLPKISWASTSTWLHPGGMSTFRETGQDGHTAPAGGRSVLQLLKPMPDEAPRSLNWPGWD